MSNLSNWDFAEHFKAKEIAELIIGIPPEKNTNLVGVFGDEVAFTEKITPVLRRMKRAYLAAGNTLHAAATWGGTSKEALEIFSFDPMELQSELMEKVRSSSSEFGLSVFAGEIPGFDKAYFGRSEIHRWLEVIGMKSVYQFDSQQAESDGQIAVPVTRWPWGSHHTELLGHLEAAAQKLWADYDPADTKRTAPKNQTVIDWLKTERNLSSKKMAQAIATMLRPNDLPTGPRK